MQSKMKLRYDFIKNQPWAVQALERDDFKCKHCGSIVSLVVHHLDESRKLGIASMNNNLDNLVTLCRRCHAKIHRQVMDLKKRDFVVSLRKEGLTFAKIGERLGVSRQRIHHIYSKLLT